MKKSLFASTIALTLACGIAAETLAQTNPNQLIAQRKGAMNLQVKYFGSMLAMVQGRAPYDASTMQRNADYLAVLSQLPWDDFQPSTAAAGETRTRAHEDIYKDTAKFKAAIDTMLSEAKKLSGAVRTGDRDVIGAAVRSVGRSCNSCHESFATFNFRFKLQ
jgi:cytochrome c556